MARVPAVVKIDAGAVGRILPKRGSTAAVHTFALAGVAYGYLKPRSGHPPEACHSWTYGQHPKVLAALPLADGGTVDVYAHANRWSPSKILVSWNDDEWHHHWAWIPAGNVRRVTDSEWDIIEYHRCPPSRRGIRWGDRLPGFLPE